MSEFRKAAEGRERRRASTIEDALSERLQYHSTFRRCVRCREEFRMTDELGKRSCFFHPERYNAPSVPRRYASEAHEKILHHACCGMSERGGHAPEGGFRQGCTRCEHASNILTSFPPGHVLNRREIIIDPNDDADDFLEYIHVEPLFMLRRLAAKRGIDTLAENVWTEALLPASNCHIIRNVTDIGSSKNKVCSLQIGRCATLSVSVRAAYVNMLQRYGLPSAILKMDAEASYRTQNQRSNKFQNLLQSALPQSDDVMDFSSSSRSDGSLLTTASNDTYYDHSSGDEGEEDDDIGDLGRGQLPAVEYTQSLIRSLAGHHQDSETFYPFCIWAVCDPNPTL